MADDFGIRPARDPYPPSEPVAKARDAAIERAEAEIQRLRAEVLKMQGYDHLQMVEVSELRAKNQRLRDALERINAFPFDVMATPEQDVGAIKEIARAALIEEAERAIC